jgi:STE24 endopeptidase
MEKSDTSIDPDRQLRARQYARIRRRLWALRLVLDGIYLLLWVQMGWAIQLRQALTPRAAGGLLTIILPWWIELALLALIIFGTWALVTLPLGYYSGFVLPHRYHLSTQTRRGWIIDLFKGSMLGAMLGLPLLVALYCTIRVAPITWWIWAAGGFTLVTAVLTAIAPVLLMPIFYKFKPLAEEHAELEERLTLLAQKAGTHVHGVFSFDMSRRTRAGNAALVGLGRTRRIILGDTLLSEFTSDEIETILAHELAHHAHKDIPLMLVVQSMFNFITFFLASQGMNWAITNTSLTDAADPAGLPILALLMGITSFLTMPLANAFSRWRESLADDYALEMTLKPKPFASAMSRLANQNLAEADPEQWVVFLLHSHPPLRDRIQKAYRFSSPVPEVEIP